MRDETRKNEEHDWWPEADPWQPDERKPSEEDCRSPGIYVVLSADADNLQNG